MDFNDGGSYEKSMGTWSRLVGNKFIEWLSPQPNKEWLDVGCGNGAFSELIIGNGAPSRLVGIDPSPVSYTHLTLPTNREV